MKQFFKDEVLKKMPKLFQGNKIYIKRNGVKIYGIVTGIRHEWKGITVFLNPLKNKMR